MVAHSRATVGAYTLRALNAAQAIAVRTNANNSPVEVRRPSWSQARAVLEVLDRWRIDDEWWRDRPISRLYQVLLLEGGLVLTVYHDLAADSWLEQHDGRKGR